MGLVKEIEIAAAPSVPRNDTEINKNIKNLLDAISSIIADEYIEVAKRNKDIFGG